MMLLGSEKKERIGAEPIIPPSKDGVVHRDNDPAIKNRDVAVLQIIGLVLMIRPGRYGKN